jgi:SOS-response transcriptional repressor LexA
MTVSLTPRQRELLNFIDAFQRSRGHCPSYDEMRAGIGGNRSTIHGLVVSLEERGAIRRRRSVRGVEIVARPRAVSRAPDGAPLYFVPVHHLDGQRAMAR